MKGTGTTFRYQNVSENPYYPSTSEFCFLSLKYNLLFCNHFEPFLVKTERKWYIGGQTFYLSGGTFSFYFLQYLCRTWNFCTLVVQIMAIYRHMSVQWT